MLVYVLIGIGVGMVAMVGILMALISKAPLGYEDENGFHYGKPENTTNLTHYSVKEELAANHQLSPAYSG